MDFHHVYGHKDDHLCFDSLPRLAQLKVDCIQLYASTL